MWDEHLGCVQNWKTLRPARNDVAQLLLEASALPCVTEEQHQMVRLLAAYDRWLVSFFPCNAGMTCKNIVTALDVRHWLLLEMLDNGPWQDWVHPNCVYLHKCCTGCCWRHQPCHV